MSQFSSGAGIDRGGINYVIEAQFEGRQSVEQFKETIDDLRRRVNALKNELAATSGKAGQARGQRQDRSRQQDVRATQEQAKASDKAAEAQKVHAAAVRQYEKELQRKAVSEERAKIASDRSFEVENKRQTGTEQLSRATENLTKATDRLALSEAGRFRAADAGAKGDLKEAASQQKAADAIDRRVRAQRRLASAKQPFDDTELRRTTLQADALERQFATQRQIALLQNEKLTTLKAEELAQRRIQTVERERQARAILASQGRDARGRLPGDIPAATGQRGRKPVDEFAALRRELNQTEGAANRISFTFRRLFGILAAFTAARLAVGAFNSAIRETINFMAQLEITTSGFAALLTATTDVFDQFGRVEDPQRRLALAMQESRRQMSLLRVEALQTANTFDDLVQVFTAALAPGVTAGLAVDEVRRLTLLVAQAGASIGVDAQRIETDIRAILEGTISQQRTGIARALGITDQEVRQAREAGQLFQFLEQRLRAFAVAGEDAQGTFTILQTNLRDAFLQIGQVGFLPLFEQLKNLMEETKDAAAGINEEAQKFELSPQAVAVVQQIGDGLAAAAEQLRALRDEVSFEQALGAARAFSQTLQVGAEIIRGVVQGLVEGLDAIRRIFGPVFGALRGIGLFDEDNLGSVVALITRIFVIYTAFNTLVGGTLRTFTGLVLSMSRMAVNAKELAFFWGQSARNAALTAEATRLAAANTAGAAGAAGATAGATQAAAGATAAAVTGWAAVRFWAARAATFVLRFIPVIGTIVTGLFVIRLLLSDSTDEAGEFRDELDRARKAIGGASDEGDKLAVSFQRSISPLEENVQLVERLRDSIREARREFEVGFQTLGLTGTAADLRRTRLEAELKINDELRETDQQRLEVVRELGRVRQQLREGARASGVQSFVALTEEVAKRRELLEQIEKEIDAERERIRLITEGEPQPSPREARGRSLLDAGRRESIQQQLRLADLDTSRLEALQKQAEELREQITITGLLEAKEQGLSENLLRIDTERLKIIRKQEQETANRVATLVRERAFEIQQQAEVARAEIESARRVADARRRLMTDPSFSVAELRRVEAEAELENLESQFAAERRLREKNLDAIREDVGVFADRAVDLDVITPDISSAIKQTRDLAAREEALNAVFQQRLTIQGQLQDLEQKKKDQEQDLTLLQQQEEAYKAQLAAVDALIESENFLKQEKDESLRIEERQTDELREQQRLIDDITDIISAPIQFGAIHGFTEGIQEIGDAYTQMFNALRRTVVGFRDFVADSIVSAFDPSDDTTIRERFRQFLLDIASMFVRTIIGMAIQAAVANALSGGILGAFFGRQQGGPVRAPGFHRGGRVGDRAQGMAEGGRVPNRPTPRHYRPQNLHPRDSVPIWADPREWVMRPQAVSKYGDGFMAAVNEARLDPYQLAPLAGMQSSPSAPRASVRNSVERGMQEGGRVGSVPRQAAQTTQMTTQETVLPILIANEQVADQLLKGGRSAFLRFLAEEGFRR